MKCLNCGAEIPEGAEKCPECQSPVNMERQEEKAETAAGTEETSAAPTEETPAAPAAAAPAPKKGAKAPVIAVAAVAVIAVGVFAAVQLTAKDPKEVVIQAFENVYPEGQVMPFEEIFGLSDMLAASNTANTEGSLTLAMDSCSVEEANAYAGLGMRLAGRSDVENFKSDANIALVYNGMDLANINFYYGDDTLMLSMPELTGKVITVDLGEGLAERLKASPTLGPALEESGIDVDGLASYVTEYFDWAQTAVEEGNTPFDVAALLDRYQEGCAAYDNFKAALTVEKAEKGTYTVDGAEVSCQGYSVTVSKDAMIDFLRTSSDFFLQDETLKEDYLQQLEMSVRMSELMGAAAGLDGQTAAEMQQQTYDELEDSVAQMIDYLDQALNDVQMVVYVDGDGRLAAFEGTTSLSTAGLDEMAGELTAEGEALMEEAGAETQAVGDTSEESQEASEEAAESSGEQADIQFAFQLMGGAYTTQNMTGNISITSAGETVAFDLTKQGVYDESQLTCDVSVDVTAAGTTGTFTYTGTYSLADGAYHAALDVGADGSQMFAFSVNGIVDQLEKGSSIHMDIDAMEFSVMDNMGSVTLSGDYSYGPLEGEITPPEGETMDALAATEEDWSAVLMEIMFGAIGLTGQIGAPAE